MHRVLADLETPCLLLEQGRLARNLNRLRSRLRGSELTFRAHLKTAKCVEVARLVHEGGFGSITVSTLREAEEFGRAGFRDILYAVQISPQKLDAVSALRRTGVDLKLVLDSVAAAEAVSAQSKATGDAIPCLIEIDLDGHRGGVGPEQDTLLLEIARMLSAGACLAGVMGHAGESYALSDPDALRESAEQERRGAVRAATVLRDAGFSCPVVSVGSSPTALSLEEHAGITEVRAGVYMFGDLVQANIGVCAVEDIALSVLATVIAHQPSKGWILVDCGWTALSSDRGTAEQHTDYHFGQVCDEAGEPFMDLVVLRANQEHGVIGLRPGGTGKLPDLPLGTRLRILPNHACATAAMHDVYHVVEEGELVASWPRFNGWHVTEPAMAPGLRVLGRSAAATMASRGLAREAVADAFKSLAAGQAQLFPVVNAQIDPAPGRAFSIKAGACSATGSIGLKIGTYWPDNQRRFDQPNHGSTTLLLDSNTGVLQAVVNASDLNGLRTAAANALATGLLAREDAAVLFVAGAGHQARFEARAVCDVRAIRRILIWSRARASAEQLARELSDLHVDDIIVVEDAAAAARDADIITTVTAARAPLFPAASVRPGVHISAMGADMEGKQELDPACLTSAKLFADWPTQAARIGEFQHVCRGGMREAHEIVGLGDVLLGRMPGRQSREEVTIFDSSGVAIQDLAIARVVLSAQASRDGARTIEF